MLEDLDRAVARHFFHRIRRRLETHMDNRATAICPERELAFAREPAPFSRGKIVRAFARGAGDLAACHIREDFFATEAWAARLVERDDIGADNFIPIPKSIVSCVIRDFVGLFGKADLGFDAIHPLVVLRLQPLGAGWKQERTDQKNPHASVLGAQPAFVTGS